MSLAFLIPFFPFLLALTPPGHNMAWRGVRFCFGDRVSLCLMAPGVIAHELSHLLVSTAFGHKVGQVCWFTPHPHDQQSVGFVDVRFNPQSTWQAAGLCVSAFAPALLLPLLIGRFCGEVTIPENLVDLKMMWSNWQSMPLYMQSLYCLLSIISLNVCPSLGDIRGAGAGARAVVATPLGDKARIIFICVLLVLLSTFLGFPLFDLLRHLSHKVADLWLAGMRLVIATHLAILVLSATTWFFLRMVPRGR